MNNDEYVYVIFRTEYTMVDYEIDKLYLEKIVKLEAPKFLESVTEE